MNMDTTAVVSMNPNMAIFGDVPIWGRCHKTFFFLLHCRSFVWAPFLGLLFKHPEPEPMI
jgi:hypothetical protein